MSDIENNNEPIQTNQLTSSNGNNNILYSGQLPPPPPITFSAKDTTSPPPNMITDTPPTLPSLQQSTSQSQQASNSTVINPSASSSNQRYSGNFFDGNNNESASIHSAYQNSNISSSTPTPHHQYSTKTSMDEMVNYQSPPSIPSLLFRVFLSWGFGLVCQVILMLFNPILPMHFIWGVLCIGCGMTAAFAITWSSLLLKFKITFLVVFSTLIYWVGTPIAWQILYDQKMYPPPIGVFTCIFPFEGASLALLCFIIPKAIRARSGHRKRVIAAFSSLIAPYLSFVSGLIYFRLFQFSNNTGRILLPPVYTIVMKFIQLGLDIICVRCAHSASNLLIIIGRIIASYYSFAVLSFVRNPVSVVSVVFSKLGLHIFMSLFMIFPGIELKIISMLPESLVGWKNRFEKGVNNDDEKIPEGGSIETPNSIDLSQTPQDGASRVAAIENEFDKMYYEKDALYSKLHTDATNLWFSMFSDLLAIVMAFTVYTMGRFGPTQEHYNSMFPFSSISSSIHQTDSFEVFLLYLAICFVALIIAYVVIWGILNFIIKTLEIKKVMNLVSVNWFPLNHFYVSCINFMMAYVIVVVALMPDLFYIPGIDFWNTKVA